MKVTLYLVEPGASEPSQARTYSLPEGHTAATAFRVLNRVMEQDLRACAEPALVPEHDAIESVPADQRLAAIRVELDAIVSRLEALEAQVAEPAPSVELDELTTH